MKKYLKFRKKKLVKGYLNSLKRKCKEANIHPKSEKVIKLIRRENRIRFRKRKIGKRSKKTLPIPKDIDVEDLTGCPPKLVLKIYEEIGDKILPPKKHKLCEFMRIILFLAFMRQYPLNKRLLEETFKISEATIQREVDTLLPIMCCSKVMNYVRFVPIGTTIEDLKKEAESLFEKCLFACDGSVHGKYRTHPGSYNYFRGDKKIFFIGSQLVTNIKGRIAQFMFSPGRNNDQGNWNRCWLKDFISVHDLNILVDGGYHGENFVKPDETKSKDWNDKQKRLRSIVEIVFAYIKNWKIADDRFRGNPVKHEMFLYCVYQLAAQKLDMYPIRL